jgi:hypothetical protein
MSDKSQTSRDPHGLNWLVSEAYRLGVQAYRDGLPQDPQPRIMNALDAEDYRRGWFGAQANDY